MVLREENEVEQLKSILRYPGAKWNMQRHIIPLIPEHKSYLEPFFGSGAVFFNKDSSKIETINDLDKNVVNLFRVIRQHTEELGKAVAYTPFSGKEYDNAFESTNEDPIEKARLFLLKSLQSHGFRLNEKSGWKNDIQGRERAYAVMHWNQIPDIIQQVALRLKDAQIENRDAVELIKRFNYENVFMYIDPPYLLETRTRKQYNKEMDVSDHVKLLQVIKESKAKIMLSGYDSDLYNDCLSDWNAKQFKATAEKGLKRIETIWMNY